jgi:hypothetical protein
MMETLSSIACPPRDIGVHARGGRLNHWQVEPETAGKGLDGTHVLQQLPGVAERRIEGPPLHRRPDAPEQSAVGEAAGERGGHGRGIEPGGLGHRQSLRHEHEAGADDRLVQHLRRLSGPDPADAGDVGAEFPQHGLRRREIRGFPARHHRQRPVPRGGRAARHGGVHEAHPRLRAQPRRERAGRVGRDGGAIHKQLPGARAVRPGDPLRAE